MPKRLFRSQGAGYLHFITTSCYRRQPLLSDPWRADLFLETLEEVRRAYGFIVVGYVVMPEHIHLLIGEPERGSSSTVMQVLKQRFTRKLQRMLEENLARFWQRRFYDFVVVSREKRIEKLNYIHHNPLKRNLIRAPGDWKWSSYRFYMDQESGPVLVDEQETVRMNIRAVSSETPTLRTPRRVGQPPL